MLTKTDVCEDASTYAERAAAVARGAEVIALNATRPSACRRLYPWLEPGRTVAFVGSSGVGKSTLVNALLGAERQATAGVREDDSRGRHTTTARELLRMPTGAWLIDTPGMRELRIGDAAADGSPPCRRAVVEECVEVLMASTKAATDDWLVRVVRVGEGR